MRDESPTAQRIRLLMTRMFLSDHAFYGTLLGYLRITRVEDPAFCDTMAVDGVHLFYYAPWVDTLKDPELVFVLMHEGCHVAFEHFARLEDRDPEKFNRACDYAINPILVDAGLQMPPIGLIDPKYFNLSAEAIYNMLPPSPPGGGRKGRDPGGLGGFMKPKGNPAEVRKIASEIRVAVQQSASLAKAMNAGKLPAHVQRLVDQATESKVDWAVKFRRLVNSSQDTELTFSRPNKRYLSHNIYMPGRIANAVDHAVCAIDTSGSIYQHKEALEAFSGELNGIFAEGNIDKLTVIYADAAVSSFEVFERGDEIKLKPTGGGGTAFSNTFEWIAENADDAVMVIYLTDLEVFDFGEEPHCPVVWAVYGDERFVPDLIAKVPFGEGVHINP